MIGARLTQHVFGMRGRLQLRRLDDQQHPTVSDVPFILASAHVRKPLANDMSDQRAGYRANAATGDSAERRARGGPGGIPGRSLVGLASSKVARDLRPRSADLNSPSNVRTDDSAAEDVPCAPRCRRVQNPLVRPAPPRSETLPCLDHTVQT